MREYSEVSAYIRHTDTLGLLNAIANLCASEGMVLREALSLHLHDAPALQNNRWAVHVLAGQDGWHLLRATPWSLWCDRADGSNNSRFVELVRRLSSVGFLVSMVDHYPEAYGEVLIEVDLKGQSVASGHWAEQAGLDDGSVLDTSWFYGCKLQAGRIAPRSQALRTLWQESRGLWSNGNSFDYDDCRGDSDREIFCRYLTRRLLNLSSWNVTNTDDWPADVRHTLYFEWPTGDRPEPPAPEPLPEPDVCYPDGLRVALGDAVLFNNGLASGQVCNFLFSGYSVAMVLVDDGQPGKHGIHVDKIAHGLRLISRNTVDHAQAAVRFLAENAAAGDVPSMYAYGVRHLNGIDVPSDGRIAYEWLIQAADKGHAEAQCFMGLMSKDDVKAVHYWRMAAEKGLALAQFGLGVAYQNGKGVTQDGHEARRWYNAAASQGNLAAQYNLGHLSIHSFKHTCDANADAEWFRVQAENGDAPAQWIMGLCVEYGSGGAHRNPVAAVNYYRMGTASGFGPAICNLADKYEHGTGVPQDLAEALRLYLQAAEKNVTAAFYSLGNMYKDGRGVPQDMTQALYWLKKAAADGWSDAKVVLRDLYDSDYQQALRLLEKMNSTGTAGEVPPTAEQLFEKALAVYDPSNAEALALAFALHQHAAHLGHPHALFQLGFMHLRGFATEPDAARAVALYRQAAELGDSEAQVILAELYEEGVIVPQNPVEARHWYEQAAAQGRSDAQYKLGLRASPEPTCEEMGIQFIPAPVAETPKPTLARRPWWKRW